ncbi:hypothetical protein XA68_12059 [Ophiocordyceps unilateralis]|uniref:Methyltransferase domain-containing protein n=1 Tax=Ophiocordyceps unilateralis TaxID=268505 RepID=A0A2A9PEM0_OPHUN|nr:hypothetical protein XA68_12059 [Ophiocordyceps unilateralis]
MTVSERLQYDVIGNDYARYTAVTLPFAKMAAEFIGKALGNCDGLTVLDLGGGNGLFARRALKAGAKYVDVVDISETMIELGKGNNEGEGRLRWHIADVTRPLREQCHLSLLDGQYDIVMGNWLHESAVKSVEDLEPIWQNVVDYLKPGGTFLGSRTLYPGVCGDATKGKYGATLVDMKEIPGGWRYRLRMQMEPPFVLEGTAMRDNCTMQNEIPRRLGLTDFRALAIEDTALYASDPEFWKEARDDPSFTVVISRKL